MNAPHGVGQIGRRDRFCDVAACARADDRDHILGGVRDRQSKEAGRRCVAQGLPDDVLAASSGHVYVHEHHVGLQSGDVLSRSIDILCLTKNGEGGVELAADSGQEESVVVDEINRYATQCVRAICSFTSVP